MLVVDLDRDGGGDDFPLNFERFFDDDEVDEPLWLDIDDSPK